MTDRRTGPWLAAVALLGACDTLLPDLLTNSGFDRWCEEAPCGWEVQGEVEPAPTWHPDDLGVAMKGRSSLRQVHERVDDPAYGCLEIRVLETSRGGDGVAQVELDFGDDGTVEWSEAVAFADWDTATIKVVPTRSYERVAVSVRESAGARVVLGHVRMLGHLEIVSDCAELPPVPQGLGHVCDVEEDCLSGVCGDSYDGPDEARWLPIFGPPTETCSACSAEADCEPGEVCGLAADAPHPYRGCVPAGSGVLGGSCAVDEECASGVCCGGRCSECCADGPGCTADADCAPLTSAEPARVVASVCASEPRAAGEPCLVAEQCAGTCEGPPLLLCELDARTCASDDDCMLGDACTDFGVRGGVCD